MEKYKKYQLGGIVNLKISKNQLDIIKKRKMKAVSLVGVSVLVSTIVASVPEVAASSQFPSPLKVSTVHPFLDSITSPATEIAAENDLYASVMMAQAILESGWGQSSLASEPNYNLFGIKGNYNGETAVMPTLEDSGNQNYYQIEAGFRKYPSYSESLEDYAQVLKNGTSWDPNYYSGAWKSNTETYQDATQYLTGRYATDSAYDVKLNQIIETNELDIYDSVEEEQAIPSVPESDVLVQISDTYQVKENDSLWAISQEYSVSIEQIKNWNGLDNDIIHPGQLLTLASTEVSNQIENNSVEEGASKPVVSPERIYTVVSGDTLYSLAEGFGMSLSQLEEINQLDSDLIYPGQVLFIKEAVSVEEPPAKPTVPDELVEMGQTYTIQSGDTLYSLAARFGISISDLKIANELTTDFIVPGQTLLIGQANRTEESLVIDAVQETHSYVVTSGDTLYSIARQNNVSLTQLIEWNDVTSNLIYPGQNLRIK